MIYPSEEWKRIEYDTRYQVSNFGRFRKKNPKNGYRYLKPYRKHNLCVIKIKDKNFNCGRLVASYFIRKVNDDEFVWHINGNIFDNFYRNLKILSGNELGKRTGHISRSKRVVLVENNEIVKTWRSTRTAAKDLFICRQTISDYCNKKVKKPMFNLMWEDDFFEEL